MMVACLLPIVTLGIILGQHNAASFLFHNQNPQLGNQYYNGPRASNRPYRQNNYYYTMQENPTGTTYLQVYPSVNERNNANNARRNRARLTETCTRPEGSQGICINIKRCESALNLLRTRGTEESARSYLRSLVCGYENNDPRVCCEQQREQPPVWPTPPPTPETPRITQAPSNPDDRQVGGGGNQPLVSPQCGISNVDFRRIVGGTPAKLGAWPWITTLGYRAKSNGPSGPRWLCGGTLISARHVLTAGHCAYKRSDLYVVRVGDLDLERNDDGAYPVEVMIDRVNIHPRFNPQIFVNDVAVIRLQTNVPLTNNIQPACLPITNELRSKDFTNFTPFIAGWGATEYKGPSSSVLKEAQITVVDTPTCQKAFERFSQTRIDDTVICAGAKGVDACQGDSGGPLMYPSGRSWYVIGVVSFGYKCAEPNYFGVYARVASYLDFITANMN